MSTPITIGQLAKLSGITIATLRHYERCGLLSAKTRSRSNYRLYGQDQVATILFIKNAKAIGLPLKTIKELIEFEQSNKQGGDVRAKMSEHLETIRQKLSELQRIEQAVSAMLKQCDGSMEYSDCPIIQGLYKKS